MIDTKELRRLAQAATPGPWVSHGRYIGTPRHMSYIGEVRDQCGNWSDTEKSRADAAFISAANPAAISELLDRLEAAEKSDAESLAMYRKARDERDALRAALRHEADCVEAAKAEIEALRAKITEMEQQEPVSWADAFGEPFRQKSEIDGVASPLYALPGAKGE